jgi:nitroreductase
MDIYEALYTTRAMRRVRPDPIPEDVQKRILDAAIRAPSGGNSQAWRFMLVDDPGIKGKLGPLYRECLGQLFETIYKPQLDAAAATPEKEESIQFQKMYRSASHLAEHFEDYPLILISFARFDPSGGSIFPAVWSAMLAARAEGVGSALTSVVMFKLDQVLEILDVPKDQGWNFSSLVTMGYPTGRWGVAPRQPVHAVACRNGWNGDLGFEIPEPLWTGLRTP